MNSIDEKKRKLREERDSFDVDNGMFCKIRFILQITPLYSDSVSDQPKNHGTRKTTRQLTSQTRDQDSKREKRKKTGNNAVLPFLLKEHEIFDDVTVIRKVSLLRICIE